MRVELQEVWLGFDHAAPLYQKTGDAYFDDNVLEMKSQEPLTDFLFKNTTYKDEYGRPGTEAGTALKKPCFEVAAEAMFAKTLSDAKTRYEKLILKQKMQEEK